MSETDGLSSARALRDEALAVFMGDLEIVKMEISPARMKERALDEAVEMIDSARDIAGENKAVIGAVLAALVAWLFRKPLQRLGNSALNMVRRGD
ncbi:hypothetical protein [Novosphingobium sp.]|uniref:hypothetical protein n=1 Tax=Novosphingobium sp. TaxID=1874826 RepID=UPI002615E464|nr:hypothetical protein [Novosphingobium sp.]